MKNKIFAAFAALALVGGLAACGDDNDTTTNNVVVVDNNSVENATDNEENPNDECPRADGTDCK
jgi:hypothetical protein